MYKITKKTLNDFLEYYHYFKNGSITKITYDLLKNQIILLIKINFKDNEEIKLCLVFNQILETNIKELNSNDLFNELFFKYLKSNNKEIICFANSKEKPSIYIISEFLTYKELK